MNSEFGDTIQGTNTHPVDGSCHKLISRQQFPGQRKNRPFSRTPNALAKLIPFRESRLDPTIFGWTVFSMHDLTKVIVVDALCDVESGKIEFLTEGTATVEVDAWPES